MDTSKEYILMCEKFPELQPHDLEFENGDYIVYKGKWGTYFNSHFYLEGTYDEGLINYDLNPFRLHTQDQLQEMMEDKYTIKEMLLVFDCFVFPSFDKQLLSKKDKIKNSQYVAQFTLSMEQLWLAFVMKEKHNKTWNGEEWKNV